MRKFMPFLAALLILGGCHSAASYEKQQEQIKAADVKVDEAKQREAEGRRKREEAIAASAAVKAQADAVQAQINELAARLPSALPIVRKTILAQVTQLGQLADQLDDAQGAASRQVAAINADLEALSAAVIAADKGVREQEAKLNQWIAEDQQRVKDLGGLVSTVAGTVGSFVPGAGGVAQPAAQALGGLITLIGGGGLAGAVAFARKRKGEADAAAQDAQDAQARADTFKDIATEIVKTVEAAKKIGGGKVDFTDPKAVAALNLQGPEARAFVDAVQKALPVQPAPAPLPGAGAVPVAA